MYKKSGNLTNLELKFYVLVLRAKVESLVFGLWQTVGGKRFNKLLYFGKVGEK